MRIYEVRSSVPPLRHLVVRGNNTTAFGHRVVGEEKSASLVAEVVTVVQKEDKKEQRELYSVEYLVSITVSIAQYWKKYFDILLKGSMNTRVQKHSITSESHAFQILLK